MIIPTKLLLEDQRLIDAPYRVHSLDDLNLLEPAGIYTVSRTYDATKTVLLDAHLDRLEESAALESIPFRLDRVRLR
ncbi:MAG: hypothetical protein ACERKY_09280, partial [Anaerolineales bacterium]